MESHPQRDDELADVVDELEKNVADESAVDPTAPEPAPTDGAKQEPPD